ncbi:hypothetical protein DIPPA_21783 [Diplonema papillatum]|nr:hypothetical protein DIPPA_21783 [Diplonema papillatum]
MDSKNAEQDFLALNRNGRWNDQIAAGYFVCEFVCTASSDCGLGRTCQADTGRCELYAFDDELAGGLDSTTEYHMEVVLAKYIFSLAISRGFNHWATVHLGFGTDLGSAFELICMQGPTGCGVFTNERFATSGSHLAPVTGNVTQTNQAAPPLNTETFVEHTFSIPYSDPDPVSPTGSIRVRMDRRA